MSYLKPTSSATTGCSCEDVDGAAERILREHLPATHDAQSTLATLDRLSALRERMTPGRRAVEAVEVVREGRAELERRTS